MTTQVSDPHRIISCGVSKLTNFERPLYAVWAGHHNACSVQNRSGNHKAIKFRTMKNIQVDRFRQRLCQVPWNNVLLYDNPKDALNAWYGMFIHTLNRHAPKVVKQVNAWQQRMVKN